jgi:ribosomal protein L37E
MGDYQVLFSGEVSRDSDMDAVRARLARELGIDDRKARTLFSGRTVVIRSQLEEGEARRLQQRLADLGAMCRIKSLAAPRDQQGPIDKDALRLEGHNDQTLKDITAAHVECPRCGHLQLESSHCTRCGIDIATALKKKREEDMQIAEQIRELRYRKAQPGSSRECATAGAASTPQQPRQQPRQQPGPIHSESRQPQRKRSSFVRDLFRRS